MFKTLRVVIVLAAAVVIAVLLVELRPEAERRVPEQTGRLVEIMPARTEAASMLIEAYGTVRPSNALKLVAEVSGRIVRLHPSFEAGNFVAQGTELIVIDPRNYQLEFDRRKVQIGQTRAEISRLEQEAKNLQASIRIARSDEALSRQEFVRIQKLRQRNVIAQTTLDQTEQRYLTSLQRLQDIENQLALIGPRTDQLNAQLAMAEVMLQQAALDLERTRMTAPFDGWVLETVIEVGQHVNVTQYLGTIYNDGALEIEVRIPVKDLKWLPADARQLNASQVDIVFENGDERHRWKGRVARTKAQLDEKTRTLPIVIEVVEAMPEEGRLNTLRLRPGMFVTARITGREVDEAFVLPRHVVYPGDVVYVVENNRLKMKPVTVLRQYKDTVIIDNGLSEGDLIVKTPLPSAAEGMRVRVVK